MSHGLSLQHFSNLDREYACSHCMELTRTPLFHNDEVFCCHGCQNVFEILKTSGLQDYYSIREPYQREVKLIDEKIRQEKSQEFTYLRDPDFVFDYSFEEKDLLVMDFFLENIQCPACLWLIENLPFMNPQIKACKLNFSRSIVTIKVPKEKPESFFEAALLLDQLGYKPHPLGKGQDSSQLRKNEDRSMLIKIGVAASCSMNIMLYAVSIYSGATDSWKESFSLISFVLSLPVIFYSALPFYQSSLQGIRNKQINIDLPISVAIILGFVGSCFLMLTGSHDLYFDTITTLVFLLLLSRYALAKAQKKALDSSQLESFFYQNQAHIYDHQEKVFQDKHAKYIKPEDLLLIRPGETILADGEVIEGSSYINLATFNGEPEPRKVSLGEEVFAGTKNISESIQVKVKAVNEHTKLGKILQDVQEGLSKKSYLSELSKKFSTFFLFSVFLIAAVGFTYLSFSHGVHTSLSRILALIIISCPCAFALATPLAYTKALSLGAQNGIFIKNELILEKLLSVKHIFFDKTGTLTNGQFHVLEWNDLIKLEDISSLQVVYELEKSSNHPIALGLRQYIQKQSFLKVGIFQSDIQEIVSKGVEGTINQHFYQLKRLDTFQEKVFALYRDGQQVTTIKIADEIKPHAKKLLNFLKEKKIDLYLLSGDLKNSVSNFESKLKFSFNQVFSNQTPQSKAQVVETFKNTMIVGDGVNDSLSMAKSELSIAVKGSADVSLRVADIYISQDDLRLLEKLFVLSLETRKIILRNLFLSCFYNITGIILSLMGYISPLVAAIAMPISSLTVIGLTLWATPAFRSLKKEPL